MPHPSVATHYSQLDPVAQFHPTAADLDNVLHADIQATPTYQQTRATAYDLAPAAQLMPVQQASPTHQPLRRSWSPTLRVCFGDG